MELGALNPRFPHLLCTTMMRGAGLEWYETGDVWNRVVTTEGRSTSPSVNSAAMRDRAQEIRALLLADTHALFGHDGVLGQVTDWASAFQRAGQDLRRASGRGALGRGLRDVLSLHVIFHWNRLGLSLRTQSHLAAAARSAVFDRTR
ncbi:thiopeptide-type bacteriocin biosynthesis protein [Streptomyces sp. NPDC007088]|uniref:thiopeptide-type bacteriocin biosynthesis protein n=1 Tax=Streptomyces sp. NPDC007088 TaxID=3364773 RepID=UPI00368A1002